MFSFLNKRKRKKIETSLDNVLIIYKGEVLVKTNHPGLAVWIARKHIKIETEQCTVTIFQQQLYFASKLHQLIEPGIEKTKYISMLGEELLKLF